MITTMFICSRNNFQHTKKTLFFIHLVIVIGKRISVFCVEKEDNSFEILLQIENSTQ